MVVSTQSSSRVLERRHIVDCWTGATITVTIITSCFSEFGVWRAFDFPLGHFPHVQFLAIGHCIIAPHACAFRSCHSRFSCLSDTNGLAKASRVFLARRIAEVLSRSSSLKPLSKYACKMGSCWFCRHRFSTLLAAIVAAASFGGALTASVSQSSRDDVNIFSGAATPMSQERGGAIAMRWQRRRHQRSLQTEYSTFVLTASDGDRGYASVCESDVPSYYEDVGEQRISFAYSMFLTADAEDPGAKMRDVEERMHFELSRVFLKCGASDESFFYVNSIITFPPDELLGECEQDATTEEEGTVCYSVNGQLTIEIAYPSRRWRLQRQLQADEDKDSDMDVLPEDEEIPVDSLSESLLSDVLSDPDMRQYLTESLVEDMLSGTSVSEWLSDPDLVSTFGSFFVGLLEGNEALLDDEVVKLLFKGFLNGYGQGQKGDALSSSSTPAPLSYTTVAGATTLQQPGYHGYARVVPFAAVGLAALILILATAFVALQKSKKRHQRVEPSLDESMKSSRGAASGTELQYQRPLEETIGPRDTVQDVEVTVDDVDVLSDLRAFEASLHTDDFGINSDMRNTVFSEAEGGGRFSSRRPVVRRFPRSDNKLDEYPNNRSDTMKL